MKYLALALLLAACSAPDVVRQRAEREQILRDSLVIEKDKARADSIRKELDRLWDF